MAVLPALPDTIGRRDANAAPMGGCGFAADAGGGGGGDVTPLLFPLCSGSELRENLA